MSAPTIHLLTTHPALSLLAAITDGMPRRLAEGALCGLDPELHTGPDAFTDESADERAAREQVAREVCAECPVRALCLARALETRPSSGVWASILAADLLALLSTTEQRTEVA
ncbi:WhiB family transcriptional regulator [Streptosporangium lutulentum]